MLLRRYCDFALPEDDEMKEMYFSAVYGNQPVTEEDRERMNQYALAARKACRKAWNLLQWIYYRWIKGIE